MVKELIKMQFPLNLTKHNGLTALSIAISRNQEEIMKLLLQAGADVNHVGKNGLTALYIAIKYKNTHAVKLLLDLGANVYNKDIEIADTSPIY